MDERASDRDHVVAVVLTAIGVLLGPAILAWGFWFGDGRTEVSPAGAVVVAIAILALLAAAPFLSVERVFWRIAKRRHLILASAIVLVAAWVAHLALWFVLDSLLGLFLYPVIAFVAFVLVRRMAEDDQPNVNVSASLTSR